MGCPAPKVVKNGDGSKLLQSPMLVEEIVKEVVKNTNKPVTVKLRKGWDKNSVNAVEIAKIIENAVWKKHLILMFTETLFTITQNWKQPKYPLTDNEQTNVIYTLLLFIH